MVKLKLENRSEVVKPKIEASIVAARNRHANELDKPYPVKKYPAALCLRVRDNDKNDQFVDEVKNWCASKSEEDCKLRERRTNSRQFNSYNVYFSCVDSVRDFLVKVVNKFSIEREATPELKAMGRSTNVTPELLLKDIKPYFKGKELGNGL